MSKSTSKNNRMMHRQIINACNEVKFQRKEECRYCDIFLRIEVVKFEGPKDTPFKTVPVGWEC